jgi:RHS repeat-associated protein
VGTSGNEWRFTGELQDSRVARGMYYLRARYYDPALGRFIGRDPLCGLAVNAQSLNRYPYVRNSPVIFVDPSGMWCPRNPEDCVPDPVEDWIKDRIEDLTADGYLDVNITVAFVIPVGPIPVPIALTFGFQVSKEGGFNPYGGAGLGGPPGAGVSLNVAPGQDISQGGTCSGQWSTGPLFGPLGGTLQGGVAGLFGSGPSFFGEAGPSISSPGAAGVCYWVP